MDREALNRYINKLHEDIRNIKYQINSILKDIQNDKKQSYIEKRIDRLISNYKTLQEKYKMISEIDKKEIVQIQGVLINLAERIELVCQIGSKDVDKQNIKFKQYSLGERPKNFVYLSEMQNNNDNDNVVNIYGSDGQIEFVYIDNNHQQVAERVEDKTKLRNENEKESKIKRLAYYGKSVLKRFSDSKILKRIVAFGMGLLMLIPAAKAISQQNNDNETVEAKTSHSDTMNGTTSFNHKFFKTIEELEKFKDITKKQNEVEIQPENEIKQKEVHIIAPAQCKYTEVSDGSGRYGIFSEETEVAIYNRALIRTNADGSKSILRATKIGQTWEEYAKEQGLDYNEFKEYIENNENIQEIISTMSVDGKNIYGWIPASNLEYRSSNHNVEISKSYFVEAEGR